jgi:hypothetical protein
MAGNIHSGADQQLDHAYGPEAIYVCSRRLVSGEKSLHAASYGEVRTQGECPRVFLDTGIPGVAGIGFERSQAVSN